MFPLVSLFARTAGPSKPPRAKPEPPDYGPPVPLSPDSDDDFNPGLPPAGASGVKRGAAEEAGSRKRARGEGVGGARARAGRRRGGRTRAKGEPFKIGASSEDDDGGAGGGGGAAGRRKTEAIVVDSDDGDDDFGQVARRKSRKKPKKRSAADRLASNPLRLLAGPSPLSDSDVGASSADDDGDHPSETRKVIEGGVLRVERVGASRKGKEREREVIEIESSETEAASPKRASPAPVKIDVDGADDSDDVSSCSSDDGTTTQRAKLVERQCELQTFGRVLGHRERRTRRRTALAEEEAAKAKAQVSGGPMAVDADESSEDETDSDDDDKTPAERAAKLERLRAEIAARDAAAAAAAAAAQAQVELAAAGPIVPPPLPVQLPAADSGSETDDDDDQAPGLAAPRPPAAVEADFEDGNIRPAFAPPPAQRSLGPLVLHSPASAAGADGSSGREEWQVNKHINRQLREYQRDGVRFLWQMYGAGKGAILGDDMGLGKTIQVIAFLSALMRFTGERLADDRRRARRTAELERSGRLRPGLHADNPKPDEEWPTALIVAPSSVCENWIRELATWGFFTVGYCAGGPRERSTIMSEFRKGWYDIIVMSLETARQDIINTKDDCFTVAFVDEVHKVKNPKAQLTKALKQLEHPLRFGLTGTAIQNRFEEFWCILDWARPGEVGSRDEWDQFVTHPIKLGQAHNATVEQVLLARVRAAQLVTKILPHFFLRRTKALIAHQMPKKTEKVVLCSLTSRQFDCLERLRDTDEVQAMLDPTLKIDVSLEGAVFRFLAMFKKVSNHLALILPQPEDDLPTQALARRTFQTIYPEVDPDDLQATEMLMLDRTLCGKWKTLDDLLDMWRPNSDSNENKVLIFSTSVRLLRIIAEFLKIAGREFLFLHGGVPTGDRMPMVDQFQTDPNVYVFLISTLAGGVGLNLTAANKVVIFDPSWNPSNDLQAMDRAFRIGQQSDVEVFRLIAAGSIEENIYSRQLYKQQMSAIGYDGKHEKRMFSGIIDSGEKGELFGLRNLFALERDAITTTNIRDRIRDAEQPFVAPPGADDFDDDKGDKLIFSQKDKYDRDVKSLLDGGAKVDDENEDITRLLGSAGASYIASDKDILGQEELERKIFDECRRFRRKNPHAAKSQRAFDLKPEPKPKSPPKKLLKGGPKDLVSLFTPPVRVKKTEP